MGDSGEGYFVAGGEDGGIRRPEILLPYVSTPRKKKSRTTGRTRKNFGELDYEF